MFRFDPVLMKRADKQNRHKSSYEFEVWPEQTISE